MAKSQYQKRKEKESEVIAEVAEPIVTLNREGFDIFFDPTIRKFIRVSIEYDLVTGQAKVKESKLIADSEPVAVKKMTDLFVRKIMKLSYT